MKNLTISKQLLMLVAGFMLALIAISYFSVQSKMTSITDERYNMLRTQVESSFSIMDAYNERVTAGELRAFIERFERVDAEKKDIADQQKEVMAEAKARGYNTKIMRTLIALRKRDKDDIAEEEAVMDMYTEALGM